MIANLDERVVQLGVDSEILECGPGSDAVCRLIVAPSLCFKFAENDRGRVFSGGAGGISVGAFGELLPLDGGGGVTRTTQDGPVRSVIVVVEVPVPSPLTNACGSGCFTASRLVIGISVAGAACG